MFNRVFDVIVDCVFTVLDCFTANWVDNDLLPLSSFQIL